MTAKKLVQDFYKSDALINPEIMKTFLHPEFVLEWNSTTGFVKLDFEGILNYCLEISKSYIRTKVRISNIIKEKEKIALNYSLSVKTIENPREEMLLANFFVIWEIKDMKLFKGYQMSQLS